MSILHLNLHREYFAAIANKTKQTEYRRRTPYWKQRLEGRRYDVIQFRNGYATKAPEMQVEFLGVRKIQTAEVKEGETLRLTAGAEVVEAIYGNLPVANQTVDVTKKIVAFTKNGELNVKADNALGVHEVPLKVPNWDGRKITLLDLATHTSGLPRDGVKEWTVPGLYDFLEHHKLRRKPGTKVEYSNLAFGLLGQALALKAGTNYEALVQERICRPLNMDSTCIMPTPELRPRWAKSHNDEGSSQS